jgi:hypothetical protein
MITGKTSTGFSFEIDESNFDSWELLELMSDVETNAAKIVPAARMLLGNEYEPLKEHVKKTNDGRMPIETVTNEIMEIFSMVPNGKNS